MNSSSTKKVLFGILFICLILSVNAYPPLPTEFYGNVTDYKLLQGFISPGQTGKVIRAYDSSGVLCGSFSIQNQGYYGVLSCLGDDDSTATDEGATIGEEIRFTYDNLSAFSFGEKTYSVGEYHVVNIIFPAITCGDEICMKGIELCGTEDVDENTNTPHICNADCGECSPINLTVPPNATATNGSASSGGGSAGGAGGGSSGGGGGGSSGGGGAGNAVGGNSNIIINASKFNDTKKQCKEEWNCTDWGECFSNETQVRTCFDKNTCNTTRNKPPDLQECIYFGTCFDEIQNGKETGIDCGGPCRPCPGHEGEPNCFDGLRNCHDGECEQDVDCGGVCSAKCEKPKIIENPIQICNKPTELFRLDFLLLYLLVVIFTIIYVVIEKEREKKIKSDDKLKEVDKARKYLLIEKSIVLFVIFVILLLASTITYYIFFYCSKNFYDFIKFLIPAVIIIPVLAFIIMRMLEYSEKDRKEKLDKFLNTHHEHIKKMILLQNDYLKELEVEISNDIYQLSLKEEFKKTLEDYPELKVVYRDMIVLYDKYKAQKTALGIEKELIDNINALETNVNFKKLREKHDKVKVIYDKLATLYKSYEEKEELYKELKEEESKDKKDNNKEKKE